MPLGERVHSDFIVDSGVGGGGGSVKEGQGQVKPASQAVAEQIKAEAVRAAKAEKEEQIAKALALWEEKMKETRIAKAAKAEEVAKRLALREERRRTEEREAEDDAHLWELPVEDDTGQAASTTPSAASSSPPRVFISVAATTSPPTSASSSSTFRSTRSSPPASLSAALNDPPPASSWYYVDDSGNMQGPFPTSMMTAWYTPTHTPAHATPPSSSHHQPPHHQPPPSVHLACSQPPLTHCPACLPLLSV